MECASGKLNRELLLLLHFGETEKERIKIYRENLVHSLHHTACLLTTVMEMVSSLEFVGKC